VHLHVVVHDDDDEKIIAWHFIPYL